MKKSIELEFNDNNIDIEVSEEITQDDIMKAVLSTVELLSSNSYYDEVTISRKMLKHFKKKRKE